MSRRSLPAVLPPRGRRLISLDPFQITHPKVTDNDNVTTPRIPVEVDAPEPTASHVGFGGAGNASGVSSAATKSPIGVDSLHSSSSAMKDLPGLLDSLRLHFTSKLCNACFLK
eukprot:GHVT01059244.1.p2 GENE.GHVT01059244.1~~GHVT01059244.1.p2  ORF type:complete len:113 (+),score=10.88 GHVT01059244.1:1630-1968(+)